MAKTKVNGKQKGADYELKTAKLLCNWWQEEFHRVPASGGLHWKKDNRVSGDIIAQQGSIFPFSIECKKHEGWTFEQILKGTGEVEKWWKQCTRDADEFDRIPLLIFSKNFAPDYFMMPEVWLEKLPYDKYSQISTMTLHTPSDEVNGARVIGIFTDLIKVVSKADIIKAYQLQRRVGS